ncbi:MAG TPA: hypothetical protein QF423_01000, partial [Candidatus Scalindua sp.]|nr:hypothetical protein [Candidatus Scalindua sp.]
VQFRYTNDAVVFELSSSLLRFFDCEDEEFISDFEEEDEDENDEDIDNIDSDEIESIEYKTFRYDLCSKCHSRYLQDPLSINSIRRGRFSEN